MRRALFAGLAAIVLLSAVGAAATWPGANSNPVTEPASDRAVAPGGGDVSGAPGLGFESDGKGGQPYGDNQAPTDRSITYYASLGLEVSDVEAALNEAERLIKGLGGRVESSSRYTDGYQYPRPYVYPEDTVYLGRPDVLSDRPSVMPVRPMASVTYRVPAANLDAARDALKRLGTLLDESLNSNDVTDQVTDIDAQLRNLRATETALLDVMGRATETSDILTVLEQLSYVRGQIEQLEAQAAQLGKQVAEATITVTFSPPYVAVEEQTRGWTIDSQIDAASAALIGFGQLLVSGAIWTAIVGLPLVLFGLLFIGLPLMVWRRRKAKAHAAAKDQPAA